MSESDRAIEAFCDWAKRRGVEGREVEHRRVATELLRIARGNVPLERDLEELAASDREAASSPNQIVVAQKIGAAMQRWGAVEGAALLGHSEQRKPRAAPIEDEPDESSPAPAPSKSKKEPTPEGAEPPPEKGPKASPEKGPKASPEKGPKASPEKAASEASTPSSLELEDAPAQDDPEAAVLSAFASEDPIAGLPEPDIRASEPGAAGTDARDPRGTGSSSGDAKSDDRASQTVAESPLARVIALARATPPLVHFTIVVFVAICLTLIARPPWLFPPEAVDVTGSFSTRHLGLVVDLGSVNWEHAARRDHDERRGAWERNVSVLFRGVAWNNFSDELTLVRIDGPDAPTEADVREVGAAELSSGATSRNCRAYRHPEGGDGTLCTSISGRTGMMLSQVEAYFPLGNRLVFYRWLRERPGRPEGAPIPTRIPDEALKKAEEMIGSIRLRP